MDIDIIYIYIYIWRRVIKGQSKSSSERKVTEDTKKDWGALQECQKSRNGRDGDKLVQPGLVSDLAGCFQTWFKTPWGWRDCVL